MWNEYQSKPALLRFLFGHFCSSYARLHEHITNINDLVFLNLSKILRCNSLYLAVIIHRELYTRANLGIPRVLCLILEFSELVLLLVPLSLNTKCSSYFSGKLQIIHHLPEHSLRSILTPSYATERHRGQIQFSGSVYSFLTILPLPTSLKSNLPILPSIKVGDAGNRLLECTPQITAVCSVYKTGVLPREVIPAVESIKTCVPAGWGLIYAWGSLPYVFFPASYT